MSNGFLYVGQMLVPSAKQFKSIIFTSFPCSARFCVTYREWARCATSKILLTDRSRSEETGFSRFWVCGLPQAQELVEEIKREGLKLKPVAERSSTGWPFPHQTG